MTNTQKPCPFCGSPARSIYRYGEYRIGCGKCDVFFCGKTPKEALEKWNRRHETAPEPTITTKDRFGLVQGRILTLPDGSRYKLDITHRMLTARELAAATGFPPGYIFVGGDTAAKKMIGNAVPPPLAEALYLSA